MGRTLNRKEDCGPKQSQNDDRKTESNQNFGSLRSSDDII